MVLLPDPVSAQPSKLLRRHDLARYASKRGVLNVFWMEAAEGAVALDKISRLALPMQASQEPLDL